MLLPRFVAFMEERQALHITVRLALEWVLAGADSAARRTGPAALLHTRLCSLSQRHRRTHRDSAAGALAVWHRPEPRPYLYTEQEVRGLLEAALQQRFGPSVRQQSSQHSRCDLLGRSRLRHIAVKAPRLNA